MMAAYIHLCSIAARHEFHEGDFCDELGFVPSEQTRRLLSREALLLKESPGQLHLIGEAEPKGEEEDVVLRFGVTAREPAFALYTHLPALKTHETLQAGNGDTSDADEDEERLHAEEVFGAKDVAELPDDGFRQGNGIGAAIKPLAVVQIDLKKLRAARARRASPCRYALRFAARQTYWKYYFAGDAPRDARVVDATEAVSFERTETDFYDGRRATVFLSAVPIPMRRVPPQRFQLRVGDRLLYPRLPNASLERMGTHAGSDVLVSEIYVNR